MIILEHIQAIYAKQNIQKIFFSRRNFFFLAYQFQSYLTNFRKAPYNVVKMHFRAIPLPKVHDPIQYLQLHVKILLLCPCPFLPQPCKILKRKYLPILLIRGIIYLQILYVVMAEWSRQWTQNQDFFSGQRYESWPRRNRFSFNFCLFSAGLFFFASDSSYICMLHYRQVNEINLFSKFKKIIIFLYTL